MVENREDGEKKRRLGKRRQLRAEDRFWEVAAYCLYHLRMFVNRFSVLANGFPKEMIVAVRMKCFRRKVGGVMVGKKRKLGLVILLMICALSAGRAEATVVNDFLPHSSHYQGQMYFYYQGSTGRIEFAVYDTETNPDEFVGTDEFDRPGDENYRYIYAYQIFSDATSTGILDYFGVIGLGENSIEDMVEDIGEVDDTAGGQDPNQSYFGHTEYSGDLEQMGIWEFDNGHLAAGEHSWFLVLRSNSDWTVGRYTFNKTLANTTPIPEEGTEDPEPVPEPATVILLGLGSIALITTKRT